MQALKKRIIAKAILTSLFAMTSFVYPLELLSQEIECELTECNCKESIVTNKAFWLVGSALVTGAVTYLITDHSHKGHKGSSGPTGNPGVRGAQGPTQPNFTPDIDQSLSFEISAYTFIAIDNVGPATYTLTPYVITPDGREFRGTGTPFNGNINMTSLGAINVTEPTYGTYSAGYYYQNTTNPADGNIITAVLNVYIDVNATRDNSTTNVTVQYVNQNPLDECQATGEFVYGTGNIP